MYEKLPKKREATETAYFSLFRFPPTAQSFLITSLYQETLGTAPIANT